MPEEPKDEPTQYTEQGLEIPVTTRDEIESVLEKITRPYGKRRRRTLGIPPPCRWLALHANDCSVLGQDALSPRCSQ
jgi:hypothetical protein